VYITRGENPRGIYSYIRHPSYIVFSFLTFGTSLYLLDTSLFIISIVIYICLYFCYMIEERHYLKTIPSYREYFERTNRFLPNFPLFFSLINKKMKNKS
jgi:protein-S-isoprenylcysteine O-methyltransferase Ste14